MYQRKEGDYPSAGFRTDLKQSVLETHGFTGMVDSSVRDVLHAGIYGMLRQSDLYLNRQYNLRDNALALLADFDDEPAIADAIAELNKIGVYHDFN